MSARSAAPSLGTRTARAAVAVCCVLGVTACSGPATATAHLPGSTTATTSSPAETSPGAEGPTTPEPTTSTPQDGRSLSGGAEPTPTDLTAAQRAALDSWRGAAAIMSPPTLIAQTTTSSGPVKITRRYTAALPLEASATFAYFDAEASTWVAVPSVLSADRTTLSASVARAAVWSDLVSATTFDLQRVRETALAGVGVAWEAAKTAASARHSPPRCESAPPGVAVSLTPSMSTPDAALTHCAESISADGAEMRIKTRVNRGYSVVATEIGPATHLTRFVLAGSMSERRDSIMKVLANVSPTLAEVLKESTQGSRIGPGDEVWVTVRRDDVRRHSPLPVVRVKRQALLPFVITALAELLSAEADDQMDALAATASVVGACASNLQGLASPHAVAPGELDPVAAALSACLTAGTDPVVERLAEFLSRRPNAKVVRAEARRAARAYVGKVSLYLALAGPTLRAMDYFLDGRAGLDSTVVTVAAA